MCSNTKLISQPREGRASPALLNRVGTLVAASSTARSYSRKWLVTSSGGRAARGGDRHRVKVERKIARPRSNREALGRDGRRAGHTEKSLRSFVTGWEHTC